MVEASIELTKRSTRKVWNWVFAPRLSFELKVSSMYLLNSTEPRFSRYLLVK